MSLDTYVSSLLKIGTYLYRSTQENDIVTGPEKPEDHATQKYTNTIIGRYAGRISPATQVLERHNIKSVFAPKVNGKFPLNF